MAAKRPRLQCSSSSSSIMKDILCNTCGERFKYRSKYTRHLLSVSHCRFEESLGINLQDLEREAPQVGQDALPGDYPTLSVHVSTCGSQSEIGVVDQWSQLDELEVRNVHLQAAV